MEKLLINGRPATLGQKLMGIAILGGMIALLILAWPFFLALAIFGGLFLWWKTRHIRALIKQQNRMMEEAMQQFTKGGGAEFVDPFGKGRSANKSESESPDIIEGDFVELPKEEERR